MWPIIAGFLGYCTGLIVMEEEMKAKESEPVINTEPEVQPEPQPQPQPQIEPTQNVEPTPEQSEVRETQYS